MQVRKKKEARRHENTPGCVAYEYQLPTAELDSAVIELAGRYPAKGWAMNVVCNSIVYVIEGEGRLLSEEGVMPLDQGDQALIKKGEKYALEGEYKLLFSATPAWSAAQAKNID